ncbi:Restriction endonuclease [Halomonas sp. NYA30]|nr:hypothetical protein [uncultured Halomonas sp.]
MHDSSLCDFIEARWGKEDVTKIDHVRMGGDNNDKGSRYEALFAAFLIAKHETGGYGHEVSVSAQEEAWVDDICVRISDQRKINYQAKNSAGNAASWTPELSERFSKQQVIDTEYHDFNEAEQVLLVSCKSKFQKNMEKIPNDMTVFASCEFFPFVDPATHILFEHSPTIEAISDLCAEPNLDEMQTALLAIMAQWANQPAATPIGVSELLAEAKRHARPNVFKEVGGKEPPQWLLDITDRFPSASIKMQSGDFMVSLKGLTVRLPGSLALEKVPDEIRDVCDEQELVELLFWLSSKANL